MYTSEPVPNAQENISIMIVEDHDVTRLGLKLGLNNRPNLKVVAEAADGNTAVKNAMNFKPQVILMDIGLPEMNGIDATKRVKEFDPNIRVIMFTTHHSDKALFDALAAGADGYCLKTVSFEQLDMAISTVNTGAAWLDPGIASRVLRSKAAAATQSAVGLPALPAVAASQPIAQPAPQHTPKVILPSQKAPVVQPQAGFASPCLSSQPAEVSGAAQLSKVSYPEISAVLVRELHLNNDAADEVDESAITSELLDVVSTGSLKLPVKQKSPSGSQAVICSDNLRQQLDPMERQVLSLVESGVTYDDIARSTGISVETVQNIMCGLLNRMVADSNDGDLADSLNLIPDSEFAPAMHTPFAESKPNISNRLSPKDLIDGKYEILEVLGSGGMSTVYKANNILISKIVAIKVLHKHLCEDANLVRRFQVEARAASALNHQNILNLFDLGTTDDAQPYLVMDYLEGINLNQLLENDGPIDVRRGVFIFKQVCEALMAAHEKNIVHRDLKPSNIMLTESATRADQVKIIDFGIAKVESEDSSFNKLTKTGEVIGSIAYMSPEQCMGKHLDWRSDIYSIGCTMYEAFTGNPVFSGSVPFQVLSKHVSEMPQRFSRLNLKKSLPLRLEALIFKTLMKEPERRFQSAKELRDALHEILVVLNNEDQTAKAV